MTDEGRAKYEEYAAKSPSLPYAEEAVLRITELLDEVLSVARGISERTGAGRIGEPTATLPVTPPPNSKYILLGNGGAAKAERVLIE